MVFPKHLIATAVPMLRQKRTLVLAGCGLLFSTLSFGAGVGMLLPILHLMLERKQPLGEFLRLRLSGFAGGRLAPLGQWVDDTLPKDAFQSIVWVMAVMGALVVVGACGRMLYFRMINRLVWGTVQHWQKELFAGILRRPVALDHQPGAPDASRQLLMDSMQLTSGFQALLGKAPEALLRVGLAVAVALACSPKLTLLALLAALPGLMATGHIGRWLRKLSVRQIERNGVLFRAASQAHGNALVIKAAVAESAERRRFHHGAQKATAEHRRVDDLRQLARVLQEVMTTLGTLGLACYVCYEVFRMNLEPQLFIASIGALVMAVGSLRPLAEINHEVQISEEAAARLLAFGRTGEGERLSWSERQGLPRVPRLSQSICFERVSYTYPERSEPAVDGVSLTIRAGEFVALVGANGSGKSTLLLLLGRYMAPAAGRILVDGRDIAACDLRSLRDQIGMVTQRTGLVGGTIAENIAYGRGWAPRERIIACAKLALADEFVALMPQGYETRIGPQGEGLSGGQAQRVCLARALLRDPALLILDEATSQVDAHGEARIAAGMAGITRGRTTVVIAHRLSTVMNADRILVMDRGQIVAEGTHQTLLATSPLYWTLAQTQMGGPAGGQETAT